MSRCLVTGHLGFIGSKLFAALKSTGHIVKGIDLKESPPRDILRNLRENGEGFEEYYEFKPEYIFHLACFPRVGFSLEHPVMTMRNNVLATSIVLDFAKKVRTHRVIYSSSSSVAWDNKEPSSPYALQKFFSEMECSLYSRVFSLDTVSLRYFNVYSSDQPADGPYATAVSNWMKYIREGKQPFITGTGEQRRDMAHVDDVVSANIFAMQYPKRLEGSHFDVGTGKNISLNEIKEIVLKYHPDVSFEYIPERASDTFETKANIVPLIDLGWYPRVSIKEGITECFKSLTF